MRTRGMEASPPSQFIPTRRDGREWQRVVVMVAGALLLCNLVSARAARGQGMQMHEIA